MRWLYPRLGGLILGLLLGALLGAWLKPRILEAQPIPLDPRGLSRDFRLGLTLIFSASGWVMGALAGLRSTRAAWIWADLLIPVLLLFPLGHLYVISSGGALVIAQLLQMYIRVVPFGQAIRRLGLIACLTFCLLPPGCSGYLAARGIWVPSFL